MKIDWTRTNLIIKRTHLYLSMCLLPWFVMYGITSLPFNHSALFRQWFAEGTPDWSTRWEKEYHIDIPGGADLKAIGKRILDDNGIEGAYGVWSPNNNRINVYLLDFGSPLQVAYLKDESKLIYQDRTFRWNEFLTSLHARGGYQHDYILHDLWAFVVDLFCLAMLTWIVTGLWMWWQIKRTRMWGGIAIGAGLITYVWFLFIL